MVTLFATVWLASLMGSLHCAGMCGPFVAFAVGSAPTRGANSAMPLHVAYHGGRLTTYLLLGAAAGTLGAALDLSGGLLGLHRLAAPLAGAMMVVFGAAVLLQEFGARLPAAPLPTWLRNLVFQGHRVALQMRPLRRAALIGLLTTLLPCGWLYAFAFTAAGTADPWLGALVMLAFWAGTLPALTLVATSVRALTGALAPRIPVLCAVGLVTVGLYTLTGRTRLDAAALADAVRPAVAVVSESHAATGVPTQDAALPCCHVNRR